MKQKQRPKQLVMVEPKYFQIDYEINPWMQIENQVEYQLAQDQWRAIRAIYKQLGWRLDLIKPVAGWPDLVFSANGGLVIGAKAAVANFRHPDRQGETAIFADFFRGKGLEVARTRYNFEGEGDALVWNKLILAGYPWRSDAASHRELSDLFSREVIGLQLADARFYHLDTCLTPIDDQTIAIYPPAFTKEARNRLKDRGAKLIEVGDDDATAYGLNAISDGQNIVLAAEANNLIDHYRSLGLVVWPTPISEFKKSGGGVKCLTLEIHPAEPGCLVEAAKSDDRRHHEFESRSVQSGA